LLPLKQLLGTSELDLTAEAAKLYKLNEKAVETADSSG
jgi:hypothetical protein